MSWRWLRTKPIAAIGFEGVLSSAVALRHLIADRWSFFEQTRDALREALSNHGTFLEERAELLEAIDSWRKRLVSKVATAFPSGEPEYCAANETLLGLPAKAASKASEILGQFALVLEPLGLAREPQSVQACEALRQATAEFIQVCAGTIVPADDILAAWPKTPVDAKDGKDSGEPRVYCSREDVEWQAVARHCLLHDGFATRFPVAVVIAERGDDPARGKVMGFIVEVYSWDGLSLLAPHPAELNTAHDDFRSAITDAWRAVHPPSSPAHLCVWRVERSTDDLELPLSGRSAGGAFRLAMRRAIQGRDYPRRVLVLASVDAAGRIVSLGRRDDDIIVASLKKKVAAILQHPWIDTICTAAEHFDLIEVLLDGQDRVRVQLIG